ncbi:MAG: pilus assembly protein PilM [Candidatus Eremiobacteraeota bacterium]|nr:pilus assembly protein PilM [Candidatus Eremiobacteraeota bacterium]
MNLTNAFTPRSRARRTATLPLGIDIGAARTRVALVELDNAGAPRLVAVAARPSGDDAAGAIVEAREELGSRERRCVLAVAAPDALLRTAAFPAMSSADRARAARFEAARFVSFPLEQASVRVVPADADRSVIGIARRTALESRTAAATRAGLRAVAVDDAAFALLRAFPSADAVVDVGETTTALVVRSEPLPSIKTFPLGGRAFTAAIVASLGLDEAAAEQRKRSIGMAGAGDYAREALVEQLASALIEHRASARAELRTIVLTGNGARLPGLADALERAVAIPVRLGAITDTSQSLPADVVRAASPDWALAYGLALWSCAA